MKKKSHIVAKIIHSNLESFKFLVGKLTDKDYKRIYDRSLKRLIDRGVPKERRKAFLNTEIESCLFELIPKVDTKTVSDVQKAELDEKPIEHYIKMKGFRMWNNPDHQESNPVKELTDLFNSNTNHYMKSHCKRCFSVPCCCRER